MAVKGKDLNTPGHSEWSRLHHSPLKSTIMIRKFASVVVSSLLLLSYTSHPEARPVPVDERGKRPLLPNNEHVS